MPSTPTFGRRGVRSEPTPLPIPEAAPEREPPSKTKPPRADRAASTDRAEAGGSSRGGTPAEPRDRSWANLDVLWLLFSFQGRIGRLPFWLGHIFVFVTASIVRQAAESAADPTASGADFSQAGGGMGAHYAVLFVLAAILASLAWATLAITAKRWHDRDRSAVWVFVGVVPIVGWIWQLVECGFLGGTAGPNQFGPSPNQREVNIYAPA